MTQELPVKIRSGRHLMKRGYMPALFICILCLLFEGRATAQDGEALFKTCAACHSVGGGRMIGPDLKGVTSLRSNEWLVKFIQSSSSLINSGDPDAKALFEEYNRVPMPDNNLTGEQINQILAFIDGPPATGSAITDPKQAAMQRKIDSLLNTGSSRDIMMGHDLFNGLERFTNGGAPCFSCHNATYNRLARGGTLAKDLTKAFTRLNGFAGIKGIVETPPYPSMQETYNNRPVTVEEIAYIQLFLKAADAQNEKDTGADKAWFLYSSSTAGVFAAMAIFILWFRRRRLSVNHAIIKRQERYSE